MSNQLKEDVYFKVDEEGYFWIVLKSFWDKHKHIDDMLPDWVDEAMPKWFSNAMESCYDYMEPPDTKIYIRTGKKPNLAASIQTGRQKLLEAGFLELQEPLP